MIALLQRVARARVSVENASLADISSGLLLLVSVVRDDQPDDALRLADRVAGYRVFADDAGKMNLDVQQAGGQILAVPQFTLAADTNRGRRPSFGGAAPPERGKALFDTFCEQLGHKNLTVKRGEFGANMQVELVNDGPVTFWLSTR
ncbi:MAG: D-aminoacyl-tRNA deacylase [Pseudomonadota bacterium]